MPAEVLWAGIWTYQCRNDRSLTLPSSILPDYAFGKYGQTIAVNGSWGGRLYARTIFQVHQAISFEFDPERCLGSFGVPPPTVPDVAG